MITPELCQVAVPGPRGKLLTYAAPQGMKADDLTGCRVQVQVGPRPVVGVVVGRASIAPPKGLRTIADVLETSPSIPADLLSLTRWVSEYYLCDWVETLRAALPAGLLHPPELIVTWTGPELEGQLPAEVQGSRSLSRAANATAGLGTASYARLAKAYGRGGGLLSALRRLEQLHLLTIEDRQVLDRERASTVERVSAIPGAEADSIPARATAQRRTFDTLLAFGGEAEWGELKQEAGVERATLRVLEKAGLVTVARVPRDAAVTGFDPRASGELPPLSDEQAQAVEAVAEAMTGGTYKGFLLNGVPGSGKTRVYIEALQRALALGRGAILMVPEIGLTPQVVARIHAAFDQPVAVLHSALTATQRVAAWREVLEGRTRIVVGPRSAVFAPVHNLGLIVVDEEHEESYKQQDPAPRYHARDVALVRATQVDAAVMLVSATPSLESLRLVDEDRITRLNLKQRFGAGWPKITVVDRRREETNAPYIGPHLAREIEARAERGEGIVLLITRRGFAPVLVCGECGEREQCPHCAVSLTYHRGKEPFLRCHLCGYTKRVPTLCPKCNGLKMHPLGAGTQRIEDEVQNRFPTLAPVRMDGDTTRKNGAHARILRAFGEGDAGILLGTQVVAKGHDFEHVTLVGVVNADPALYQPDFRSGERTFRLLVQAAGRAGRGSAAGEMIVQTLSPEHEVFSCLEGPDVDGFLHRQAEQRKALNYPPYSRMVMLTVLADASDRAERAADAYAAALRRRGNGLTVRGPIEAYVARVKRKWRWRISLTASRDKDPAGAGMRRLLREVLKEVETPPGVQTVIDVDPLEVA